MRSLLGSFPCLVLALSLTLAAGGCGGEPTEGELNPEEVAAPAEGAREMMVPDEYWGPSRCKRYCDNVDGTYAIDDQVYNSAGGYCGATVQCTNGRGDLWNMTRMRHFCWQGIGWRTPKTYRWCS